MELTQDHKKNGTETASTAFDPNGLAQKDSNIFGLPFTPETAQQVIIPVPWEVTVSYNAGTAAGPEAIFQASKQVDLFDMDVKDAWKLGLSMLDSPESLIELNQIMRKKAERYIGFLEDGKDAATDAGCAQLLNEINASCEKMNQWVFEQAEKLLSKKQTCCSNWRRP